MPDTVTVAGTHQATAAVTRRAGWAAAVVVLILVGASAGVLVVRHSGDSVPKASATPHPGWIFHEVDRITVVRTPGAGRYSHLTDERWTLNAPPYTSRRITYPSFATGKVELGGSTKGAFAYDPLNDAIYAIPGSLLTDPFQDPAAQYRQQVKAGVWKIKGRTTIDGRRVLRLERPGLLNTVVFVDARSYQPIETRTPGAPLEQRGTGHNPCGFEVTPATPMSTTIERVASYEYLPPTGKNLKLLDLQAQHPRAPTRPRSAVPPELEKRLTGPCGAQRAVAP